MRAALAVLVCCALPAFAREAERTEAAGLRFLLPKSWERVQPTSPVRTMESRIPRARGDKEDGELILFQFGTATGGGVSDNVERWYAQFTQPDGRPSREAAIVSTRMVHGPSVKLIDLSGTFRPQLGPMEHSSKPGYRLLGAVVEGEGGPWFWRGAGTGRDDGQGQGRIRCVDRISRAGPLRSGFGATPAAEGAH